MASPMRLPTHPPEIVHRRHDLLLASGIWRAEIRESRNVVFLLVGSTGDVIVRQYFPLEIEARTEAIYAELFRAWRTIEPLTRPVLMKDAAPRKMSAATRRVLEQLGYRFAT